MGKCRCKRCGNILILGEDHSCSNYKNFDYRYLIQQRAESDDNLDEGNDKSTESSNDNSQNLSRAFGRNESKGSVLRSLLLFQNNERNKSTNSAGSSNYAQPRNPSDSSFFHPISDFQAIQVQTNENASFTASSENAESNNRHENDFIETYKREQSAAGSSGIESKRSVLRSLLLFQNNERNKSTNSAGSSNYAQPRNPSDSSFFHPISDFQAIQVQTNQNASFTASSEVCYAESNNRHENDCIGTYKREQAAAGSSGIDIQNQSGSSGSNLMHAKPDKERKMSLQDSKSHSLKKDKKDFMDDLENVIRNPLSDTNNISGNANSTENPDLPPGDNVLKNCKMQVSECVNDEHILPEVPSQVHSKKTKVVTYMKEPHSTKKDDNVVAGPSGLCARKKKFPKTCSGKDTLKPNYQTHTGNEPFMCNICKKKFSSKSDFDRHYRTHTGEKPYECAICRKKYSRKSYLIIHYRVHTGEKPHVCEFCNKGFSQKGCLKIHVRTHTGEKPYVCEVCNKGFSQKGDLKIHVRTHTGEKPYKCPSCEESFINSSNCKKHHKRKHE
ncbi:zinc finger protein 239-like [Argiope bruennichi]|uniref:zinc finger protein 239-like n=1 Tax=Argiope bruennichi TaxID=94029 RepID=UPI002495A070|nr:zinc finger protein 239-like [Argiope bruennichi]